MRKRGEWSLGNFVLHRSGEFEGVAANAGKVSIEQRAIRRWQGKGRGVADDGAVVLCKTGQGQLREFTGPENAAGDAVEAVLMIFVQAFDYDDTELAELW